MNRTFLGVYINLKSVNSELLQMTSYSQKIVQKWYVNICSAAENGDRIEMCVNTLENLISIVHKRSRKIVNILPPTLRMNNFVGKLLQATFFL